MKTDHGVYAVRYAGMGELRQVEQWLAMNKATDFATWKSAVALNHIQSFNFVYAGRDQHIYFVHNSEMPRRNPGWNWQHYLPGDRSESSSGMPICHLNSYPRLPTQRRALF